MQFHDTRFGQIFFGDHIPRLVRALEKLGSAQETEKVALTISRMDLAELALRGAGWPDSTELSLNGIHALIEIALGEPPPYKATRRIINGSASPLLKRFIYEAYF